MAILIQRVLFEKLYRHPDWHAFRKTFVTLTGRSVNLLTPEERVNPKENLCRSIDVHSTQVGILAVPLQKNENCPKEAYEHLLALASERFSAILGMSSLHDHDNVPFAVQKTLDWVRTYALTEEIRLSEAAELCGVTDSHLSRLFHRSTGLRFQDYVSRFRLERACELLKTTNLPVTNVAYDSGYQSLSQFHRAFKAIYGKKPLEYRKAESPKARRQTP